MPTHYRVIVLYSDIFANENRHYANAMYKMWKKTRCGFYYRNAE